MIRAYSAPLPLLIRVKNFKPAKKEQELQRKNLIKIQL